MQVPQNPFRPGAGHMPPYLAGRIEEQNEVRGLLKQKVIMENIVLTGLRGVGKTVLLETIKPIAQEMGWLWASQDMSESATVSELTLANRLIADLSILTSSLLVRQESQLAFGFNSDETFVNKPVGYEDLSSIFEATPGLVSDKIKAVMEFVWAAIPPGSISGIVFAYDEAQNLTDHSKRDQFPLSMLLDVFQSLQRKEIPFLLILTGLPTLFPKLVDARTYSERMFHVVFLTQLDSDSSRDAILKPIEDGDCRVTFSEETVEKIVKISGGYPYFIQFFCKEVFDSWISKIKEGREPSVPMSAIIHKLDNDFFVGRWARATDRQRELMHVIASLESCDAEFSVQEVVVHSKKVLENGFSSSNANQMLSSLIDNGLIYKNRYGKYSFAVPLFSSFIKRQINLEK